MQYRLGILFLPFILFVASANYAWACGSDNTSQTGMFQEEFSEKSCCSKDEAHIPSVHDSEHRHSSSNCPCDHENDGCHCPGCGMIGCSSAAFAGEIPPGFAMGTPLSSSAQKMAFYFAGHLPEGVYLSIWQPPKMAHNAASA